MGDLVVAGDGPVEDNRSTGEDRIGGRCSNVGRSRLKDGVAGERDRATPDGGARGTVDHGSAIGGRSALNEEGLTDDALAVEIDPTSRDNGGGAVGVTECRCATQDDGVPRGIGGNSHRTTECIIATQIECSLASLADGTVGPRDVGVDENVGGVDIKAAGDGSAAGDGGTSGRIGDVDRIVEGLIIALKIKGSSIEEDDGVGIERVTGA